MSEHAIEDLVEDSIRLVLDSDRDAAAKRALIRRLYGVQYWFDTSDTTGRLRDELAGIGYRPGGESGDVALLPLLADLFAIADGDVRVMHDWLALAIEALIEFGDDGAFPATAREVAASPALATIRELAAKHAIPAMRRRGRLSLRGWRAYRDHFSGWAASPVERLHIVRLLIDLDQDPDTIVADAERAIAKIDALDQGALAQVADAVAARGPFTLLFDRRDRTTRQWRFAIAHPNDAGTRYFLGVEHEADLKVLAARIHVQSPVIERWQGAAYRPELAHFTQGLFNFVPRQAVAGDAAISPWGAWKLPAGASAATLANRLDSMFGYWPKTKRFFAFYDRPLDAVMDEEAGASAARHRSLGERFGWFVSPFDRAFAIACHRWKRDGVRPAAEIEAVAALVRSKPDGFYRRPAWDRALADLEAGPAFPSECTVIGDDRVA